MCLSHTKMADMEFVYSALDSPLTDDNDADDDYAPNLSELESSDNNDENHSDLTKLGSADDNNSGNCSTADPVMMNDMQRGRKRVRNPTNHKKYIRKLKRQEGQEYVSTTGKVIPKKHCSLDPCGCSQECLNLINIDRRQEIFNGYCKLNWSEKHAFLAGQIQVVSKTRTYTQKEQSRRNKTRIYRLRDEHGDDKVVCKTFFKDTLSLCDGTITNALKRKQDLGTPQCDKRGKHEPHNKTKPADEKFLYDFIAKFPAYESHYCRRDSSRKYLSPNLNMKLMYDQYTSECSTSKLNPLSLFMFRHIFNTKFNLQFHPPHKDTCQVCDSYNAKITGLKDGPEKVDLIAQQELHLRKVDAVKNMKAQDIAEAKASGGQKQVLVFDLQKTLPTPVLTTGVAYYKRQMWVYNLGVHDEVTNTGFMYVWGEHIASRGAQEVASCLLKHIVNVLPTTTKEVTLYSDSCGGQNRNVKVALMMAYIINKKSQLAVINQKFFVPGHSFSTCDRDFGIIEREMKYHKYIFHPEDWIGVIQKAKKREPKFVVHKMSSTSFFTTNALENLITNRKKSKTGQKVQWLKIRWLQYRKEEPKIIYYKYNLQTEICFEAVDIAKKQRGRPARDYPDNIDLLFPRGRPITVEKKKDLLSLMKYVPPEYHSFYKSLQTVGNDQNIDFDVTPEQSEDGGDD